MSDDAFETLVAKERERLNEQRQMLLDRRHEIDEQIAGIDHELAAIDAYEAARKRKPARRTASGVQPPRGQRRGRIMQVLAGTPDGLSRSEIIEALGLQGRSAGQSVSNALAALRKLQRIDARDGKYVLRAHGGEVGRQPPLSR